MTTWRKIICFKKCCVALLSIQPLVREERGLQTKEAKVIVASVKYLLQESTTYVAFNLDSTTSCGLGKRNSNSHWCQAPPPLDPVSWRIKTSCLLSYQQATTSDLVPFSSARCHCLIIFIVPFSSARCHCLIIFIAYLSHIYLLKIHIYGMNCYYIYTY